MPHITVEELAAEAERFLDSVATRRLADGAPFVWGEGSDNVALFESSDRVGEALELQRARRFRAARYEVGLGWITGPEAYGGRELTPVHERAYLELERQYEVPSSGFFAVSLGMVGPTILACGQPAPQERYLAAMYRGDVIGCQLFSEPGAGSDLASVHTRAVRDSDGWRITGQKVWTSGAHHSDIGEILCRTNPEAPKHRGLTAFIVDMHAPGVVVRPLRQMTGGATFNEVFFDDVRVEDDHRLGEVDGGWAVALTTLMTERASIGAGAGPASAGVDSTERLAALLCHFGLDRDPIYRQELMRLHIAAAVAAYTNARATHRVAAGAVPGPELSIAKLASTQNMADKADFVARVLGPRLTADTGEWGTYAWNGYVLDIPGLRIAGGTDEVMRNILGERVLGLPKEPVGGTQPG
jgi:alkylation response protein AidB-like acyl-CoA dehydrogenase